MAIYNNREVTLLQQLKLVKTLPDMIQIRDNSDQQIYNVPTSQVKFTKEEKQAMWISKDQETVDNVKEASDDEVKSVRAGIQPSTDPEMKAIAEQKVKEEQQKKLAQENLDKAKAEAQKHLDQANQAQKANKTAPVVK